MNDLLAVLGQQTDLLIAATVVVGVAVYLLISLVMRARLSVSRIAAEAMAEQIGLSGTLAPGGRTWIALRLVREAALVASVVLIAARWPKPWVLLATIGGSLVLVAIARVLESLGASRAPKQVLRMTAPFILVVDWVVGTFVAPLARVEERVRDRNGPAETEEQLDERREEQIEEFIRDSEEEGLLQQAQSDLLREIVDAGDMIVREVMTPRTDIDAVPAQSSLREVTDAFVRSRHSRLPVFDGTLDHVIGVIALRELLPYLARPNGEATARDLMRPILQVPSSNAVLHLLRELQSARQQMAVVVDEYGGTAGIVTLEDLLEEIVGEIRDEHETEEDEVRPDGQGGWLVDGLALVEDLEELTGGSVSVDDEEGVETVGGLVFARLGRIPRIGDKIQLSPGLHVEVVRMVRRRISRVRVTYDPRVEAS